MLPIKNNILIGLFLSVCCADMSSAATLLTFDRPNLVVMVDQKGTYGYYIGYADKPISLYPDKIVRQECKLMFMKVAGMHEITVRTLTHPIKNWSTAPYAEGSINIDGPTWHIRFSDFPRGCGVGSDQDEIIVPNANPGDNLSEYAARGAYFKIVKKSNVLGIRWIGFDTLIHEQAQGKFISTGKELKLGTLVVELKKKGAYSEVQYFDVNSGKMCTAWVPSKKAIYPFPKS